MLSLTVVPALSATSCCSRAHADEPWLVRKIAAVYEPLLDARAAQARWSSVAVVVVGLVVAVVAYAASARPSCR